MILVDIYVPAVGNTYDFQLEETERTSTIIEEVAELIGQKEHCQIVGDIHNLMLCLRGKNEILPKELTLAQMGIRTGNSLILV